MRSSTYAFCSISHIADEGEQQIQTQVLRYLRGHILTIVILGRIKSLTRYVRQWLAMRPLTLTLVANSINRSNMFSQFMSQS